MSRFRECGSPPTSTFDPPPPPQELLIGSYACQLANTGYLSFQARPSMTRIQGSARKLTSIRLAPSHDGTYSEELRNVFMFPLFLEQRAVHFKTYSFVGDLSWHCVMLV